MNGGQGKESVGILLCFSWGDPGGLPGGGDM